MKHSHKKNYMKLKKTANKIASKTVPIVEKGISTVFGAINKGVSLGVNSVKSISKKVNINKKRRTRRRNRSYKKH